MKKINILLAGLAATLTMSAASMKDLKIYVNPGHGGNDSDDRNVAVPPYASGDPEGFWESKSNLIKALDIRDMLKSFGADVMLSRTTNTTADDRDLHEIGYEANAYGADFFFSIHSNATGTGDRVNQPLMLYRGFTDDPVRPEAKVMSAILNDQLLENQIASWSHNTPHLAGDYDFYNWGVGVGLGVLRKLTVPGMLSEGSHHDYIPETYRLLNNEYCWLEGYHFVKSIMEYFKTPEAFATGVVCGTAYDSHLRRSESIYKGIFYGHDVYVPLRGAKVELLASDGRILDTYTTDQLFNGVFLFKNVQPGSYKVKVSHPEYYTKETEVKVEANKVTYSNAVVDRVRNTPPTVVTYSPVWKDGDEPVACNTPVVLDFNWDMDVESVEKNFSITPAVEGTIRWEDAQYRMVFEPKRAYDTNTTYTLKIGKEAMHPGGMKMEKDFVMSFRTNDYNIYEILQTSPAKDGEVHFDAPQVKFIFKSHPLTTILNDNIVVKNAAGEQLAYNVRSRKVSKSGADYGFFQIKLSKDLVVGETYTVDVSGEVCDEKGIKIAAPFSYQFKAVDASVESAAFAMVDGLDAAGAIVKDDEATVGCKTTTVARNTSKDYLLEGAASYKLAYTFSGSADGVASFKMATASAAKFVMSDAVGLKVYGDLSANVLVAKFSNGQEVKKVDVCTLDFFGWSHITCPLSAIGKGEYSLVGFEVRQSGEVYGLKGEVYLDKISKGDAEAGVENVEVAGLRIYPNPATELLIANADCHIAGIELTSMDGKVVARAQGNVLNVTEVAAGVYVARIYAGGSVSTRKVVVKH